MPSIPLGTGLELEGGRLRRSAGPLGGDLVEAVEPQLRLLGDAGAGGGGGRDEGGGGAELLVELRALHALPVAVAAVAGVVAMGVAGMRWRVPGGWSGRARRGTRGGGGGGIRRGARDAEVVLLEGDHGGDELGDQEGEEEADGRRLAQLMPVSGGHGRR
uniref:Uncharacterized protein n=1 Tax=Arundo donax TaxID=35708 RepID=A0A0A9B8N5_ARUDO